MFTSQERSSRTVKPEAQAKGALKGSPTRKHGRAPLDDEAVSAPFGRWTLRGPKERQRPDDAGPPFHLPRRSPSLTHSGYLSGGATSHPTWLNVEDPREPVRHVQADGEEGADEEGGGERGPGGTRIAGPICRLVAANRRLPSAQLNLRLRSSSRNRRWRCLWSDHRNWVGVHAPRA